METWWSLIDAISLVAWLVAIPICFLKGRVGFGWFGILMFGTGIALSLPVYRIARDGAAPEWWLWVFQAQGVVLLVLMITIASRRARFGSWWDRRHSKLVESSEERAELVTD